MKKDHPQFKAGIYRHCKGPLYLVLGLAHDANDEDRIAVIYIGLQLNKAKSGPRLAVRTYEDFYAWVNPDNGKTLNQTEPGAVPRFTYLGQSWEEGM